MTAWELAKVLVPTLISLAAFWFARRADSRAWAAARAKTFLDLRASYLRLQGDLPREYLQRDWVPGRQTPEWRAIQRYWQHAFGEWFTTTQIDRRTLGPLWATYFAPAVRSALAHASFRQVVSDMTHGGESEFGSYCKEYRQVLDELYGKSICHGVACEICGGVSRASTDTERTTLEDAGKT